MPLESIIVVVAITALAVAAFRTYRRSVLRVAERRVESTLRAIERTHRPSGGG
ncbi:MAG: hypothetical protein GXY23_06805 [Myxococcales bacterium]|nr:hypothetical protein [Myxococcales bacterium]